MSFFTQRSTFSVKKDVAKSSILMQFKPLFFLLVLGLIFYVYSQRQELLEKLDDGPISAFALVGSPNFTTNDDIRDTIKSMKDLKGFWGQDVDLIKEQVKTLSWVKDVVVRKIWPNRLSVWVTEYYPVAVWNGDFLLAKDGTIFKLPTDKIKDKNLPHLFGPDYQSLMLLDVWKQIFSEFNAQGLIMKSLSLDERGAWQVVLDNDVIVKFGRGEWKAKLNRFVTIYRQIEVPEDKRLSYVDLRYSVGAAVGMVDKE